MYNKCLVTASRVILSGLSLTCSKSFVRKYNKYLLSLDRLYVKWLIKKNFNII